MSFSKKFHWLEIFEYWPSNSSYFCKKHPQFTSIPIHLCLFHSSWRQGLQKFVFSLALQWIIFSKKVTTMTPLIGGWLWGVITVTFFDKMSCRRARVKIKIGMVTFSHPCVQFRKKGFNGRSTDFPHFPNNSPFRKVGTCKWNISHFSVLWNSHNKYKRRLACLPV